MLTTVCCSAHLFPAIQQLLTMIAVMRGMTMVILTLLERKSWWHNRRWNSCPRSDFSVTKWVWLKLPKSIYRASFHVCTYLGKYVWSSWYPLFAHVQLPKRCFPLDMLCLENSEEVGKALGSLHTRIAHMFIHSTCNYVKDSKPLRSGNPSTTRPHLQSSFEHKLLDLEQTTASHSIFSIEFHWLLSTWWCSLLNTSNCMPHRDRACRPAV